MMRSLLKGDMKCFLRFYSLKITVITGIGYMYHAMCLWLPDLLLERGIFIRLSSDVELWSARAHLIFLCGNLLCSYFQAMSSKICL